MATYKSGATILPVWPTCSELSQKPASTAASDAPIAAFNFSDNGSIKLSNVSLFFNPRPPAITFEADPSSGLSEVTNCSETNSVLFSVFCVSPTFSTGTSAAEATAGWKAEDLTEAKTTPSLDLTVAKALPA